jgi:hypothetical protein
MMRVFALLALAAPLFPQAPLTLEQKEEFLKNARIVSTRGAKKGITGTVRVTLTDGVLTHDASIQRIDEEKAKFEGARGTEMNFRDTYKFNIAGYRVARLIGLGHMIPPSVERKYEGTSAAWTWWVEDVMIDEGERLKKRLDAPDKDTWGRQMYLMRVFDQLIANTDRNLGNILYDKDWRLWLIDHTRAFRIHTKLMETKGMDRCDAQLLYNLKVLSEEKLRAEAGEWLRNREIEGILARRNIIVKAFEKGDPSKLYEFLTRR